MNPMLMVVGSVVFIVVALSVGGWFGYHFGRLRRTRDDLTQYTKEIKEEAMNVVTEEQDRRFRIEALLGEATKLNAKLRDLLTHVYIGRIQGRYDDQLFACGIYETLITCYGSDKMLSEAMRVLRQSSKIPGNALLIMTSKEVGELRELEVQFHALKTSLTKGIVHSDMGEHDIASIILTDALEELVGKDRAHDMIQSFRDQLAVERAEAKRITSKSDTTASSARTTRTPN